MKSLFRFLTSSARKQSPPSPGYRPILEALEDRTLPSVNVNMLFATTSDSHHVSFKYQITDAAPFHVNIYRSADTAVNAGDANLGTFLISPAADGTYTATVTLDLPQSPSRPYVLVAAEPDANNSNNVAHFRTFLIGVVTHGTELTAGVPVWATQMAKALKTQGYDQAFAFDWSSLSHLPLPGLTTLAARNLAKQIITVAASFNRAPGDVIDLHTIGHSRGAGVNSQALAFVDAINFAPLEAGWLKETMLDPHPARNFAPLAAGVAEVLSGSGVSLVGNFSYRPTASGQLAALAVLAFQDATKDPLPFFGPNVDEAEDFYQHTLAVNLNPLTIDGQVNSWGLPPNRIANLSGTAIYSLDLTGIGHLYVPYWYLFNVVPTLV